MLNTSFADSSSRQRLLSEGAPDSRNKVLTESEATKQLDRIAPDWPQHLYDGAVIDHILKVINNPRSSRSEVMRRYRARRAAMSRLAGRRAQS
jgi:hypothetical protein